MCSRQHVLSCTLPASLGGHTCLGLSTQATASKLPQDLHGNQCPRRSTALLHDHACPHVWATGHEQICICTQQRVHGYLDPGYLVLSTVPSHLPQWTKDHKPSGLAGLPPEQGPWSHVHSPRTQARGVPSGVRGFQAPAASLEVQGPVHWLHPTLDWSQRLPCNLQNVCKRTALGAWEPLTCSLAALSAQCRS